MNRIQKKSVLADTTPLILAAHDQGESLLWGRYEAQLPLCGFTSQGLSCRKCLHGPCRINPFGDEPSRGVCGADRDQIVIETLFQATLEGVLETARAAARWDADQAGRELPDVAADLSPATGDRLASLGLLPVRKQQLFEVHNAHFSHKGYLAGALAALTRLGLIHYGLLKGLEAPAAEPAPAFDPEGITILVVGRLSAHDLQAFRERVRQPHKGKPVNVLLHGAAPAPIFPVVEDLGSAELALAMGPDALILAPDAGVPALEGLARDRGVPVVLVGDGPAAECFQQALDAALAHARAATERPRLRPAASASARPLSDRAAEIRQALQSGALRGALVILGEPNVKQTFFERTIDVIEYGCRERLLVIVGGALAAQARLLTGELARRGTAAGGGQAEPIYLDSPLDVARLVPFLHALDTPAVIAFPELSRLSTWATAVSFMALGFAVQVGSPLPFWGSPALTDALLRDWPRLSGGALLASPVPVDGPAQVRQVADFFAPRVGRK